MTTSRRGFLGTCAAALAALLVPWRAKATADTGTVWVANVDHENGVVTLDTEPVEYTAQAMHSELLDRKRALAAARDLVRSALG